MGEHAKESLFAIAQAVYFVVTGIFAYVAQPKSEIKRGIFGQSERSGVLQHLTIIQKRGGGGASGNVGRIAGGILRSKPKRVEAVLGISRSA